MQILIFNENDVKGQLCFVINCTFCCFLSSVANYNTKLPLIQMITTDFSPKATVISLRPRPKKTSPLSPIDSNLSQTYHQPYFSKQAPMTQSIIMTKNMKENNVRPSEGASKLKIRLSTGNNCKCDNKLQKFQVKQKTLVVSLIGQSKEQTHISKRARRISIDLDMLRLQHEQQQLMQGRQEGDISAYRKNTEPTPLIKQAEESKKSNFSSNCQNGGSTIGYQSFGSQKEQNMKNVCGLFGVMNQDRDTCTPRGRDIQIRKTSSKKIREAIMQRNTGRTKSLGLIERSFAQTEEQQQSVEHKHSGKFAMEVAGGGAAAENVLKGLFAKLTKKNLPYQQWVNYLNLSYSELSTEELHFVGLLLQRVEPHYLNSMDYLTFKFKAFQKCRKELQDLLLLQKKRITRKGH